MARSDSPAGRSATGRGLLLNLQPPTPDLTNSPGVGEGQRNATLCRLTGVHLARGEAVEQAEALALGWAAKCDPPLSESEALKAVRALALKHGRQQPPPTPLLAGVSGNARKNEESPALAPAEAPGTFFGHSPGQEGGGVGGGVVDAPAWPVLEADAWAVYDKGGQVVKGDDGRCTLRLPAPDAALETAFARLYADICGQVLSDSEWQAGMEEIRLMVQSQA